MLLNPRQERAVFQRIRVLDNGCWEWTSSLNQSGYALYSCKLDGKTYRPWTLHRLLYRHLVGPIPDGMQLDHVCHSVALQRGECRQGICSHRKCVNPAHLEVVTHAENSRRRKDTGTNCPQGHEYTADNSFYNSRGHRQCVACRKIQDRESRERGLGRALQVPHGDRTHCPQGHPYDLANTYLNPQGRRNCRACTRAAGVAYRAKKKGARAA